MQCACTILLSVTCPALPCFPTLSHKRQGFRKQGVYHKMCVSSLSTTFVRTFLILRGTERDMIKNAYWSACKTPSILLDGCTDHLVVPFAKRPSNSQGISGFFINTFQIFYPDWLHGTGHNPHISIKQNID
jgi:hypothetical protein